MAFPSQPDLSVLVTMPKLFWRRQQHRALLVVVVLLYSSTALGFSTVRNERRSLALSAKQRKRNKKKSTAAAAAAGTLKGFGRPTSTCCVSLDTSPDTWDFYERYLEAGGAGDNLQRTRLGWEPNVEFNLRGVICTRDIAKVCVYAWDVYDWGHRHMYLCICICILDDVLSLYLDRLFRSKDGWWWCVDG